MYFSVGRESFAMAQPSREGNLVASDLATRGDWNGIARELIIIKQDHRQHVTEILLRESQISYSRQIVVSGVPL